MGKQQTAGQIKGEWLSLIHIYSLLAAACLLAASCNKEEIQSETDKAGMYHITVAVTGSSPKGSVHIYLSLIHICK